MPAQRAPSKNLSRSTVRLTAFVPCKADPRGASRKTSSQTVSMREALELLQQGSMTQAAPQRVAPNDDGIVAGSDMAIVLNGWTG